MPRNTEPKGPRLVEAPEEVTTLAARIIEKEHQGLAEAHISYWMINGNWTKGGETVEADLQLVTGANRKETGNIFRVLINQKTWDNAKPEYRAYLLDNQFERCGKGESGNGEVRWYKRDWPVKAFPGVIRRHGLVTPEIDQLHKAMQTVLDFDAAAAARAKREAA
jgi:hypothetical protein